MQRLIWNNKDFIFHLPVYIISDIGIGLEYSHSSAPQGTDDSIETDVSETTSLCLQYHIIGGSITGSRLLSSSHLLF